MKKFYLKFLTIVFCCFFINSANAQNVTCLDNSNCTNANFPYCNKSINKCTTCPIEAPQFDGTNCVKCFINNKDKVIGCINGQTCNNNLCEDVYNCSKRGNKTTVTLNGGINNVATDSCNKNILTVYTCESDNKGIHKEKINCNNGCASDGKSCKKGQCDEKDSSSCQGITPICDIITNKCVGCTENSHCNDKTKPICDKNTHTCKSCEKGIYDKNNGKCVQCYQDGDKTIGCVNGQTCNNNICEDVFSCSKIGNKVTVTKNGTQYTSKEDECSNNQVTTYKCSSDNKGYEIEKTTPCTYGCAANNKSCKETQCDANDSSSCKDETPVCDITTNTCVGCSENFHCNDKTKPICDKSTHTCKSCENGVYDKNSKKCVRCYQDGDKTIGCANGQTCNNNICEDVFSCSKDNNKVTVTRNGILDSSKEDECKDSRMTTYKCTSDNKGYEVEKTTPCTYGCASNNKSCKEAQCNANDSSSCKDETPVCDITTNTCVGCSENFHCNDKTKPICDKNTHTCKSCENGVYDKNSKKCVQCYQDGDKTVGCTNSQTCNNNICEDTFNCSKEGSIVTLTANGKITTLKDNCLDNKETIYECGDDKKSTKETVTNCNLGCNDDKTNCKKHECNETDDKNCKGEKPYCDTKSSSCVQCLNNDHCKKSNNDTNSTENKNGICNLKTHTCVECSNDDECDGTMKCEGQTCIDSQKAILPILNCVQDNFDGTFTAYFGYENPNENKISIPSCSNQKGLINTINDITEGFCEQTSEFEPGRVDGSFYIIFNNDQEITWTLQNMSKETKTVKANITSTKCNLIEPTFQCIDNNDDGTFTAIFGYNNKNSFNINIPVGIANKLSLNEEYQHQPIDFISGNIENAFSINFKDSVTWNLNGKSLKVTKNSKLCGLIDELPCNTSELAGKKISIDGNEFLKMLETQTNLLLREKHPYDLIKNIEKSAKRRRKRADKTNELIKSAVTKLPDVMFNCINADFCPLEDYQETINLLIRNEKKLHRQVIMTIKQRNISMKDKRKLLNKSKTIRNKKIEIINTIPRFANNCEGTSSKNVFKTF